MNKIFIFLFFSAITITCLNANAEDKNEFKVCHNMMDVLRPKSIKPKACYEQAKAYLKEKKIQKMEGSYQAYFTLSEKDPTQKVCADFLKNVVNSTQKLELEEAQMLFENKTDQSLDQAFYSYQYCDDKRVASQNQKSVRAKTQSKTKQ